VKILLTLIILICSSAVAFGETYKWEDANGVHITDNASTIPDKYREKALAEARIGVKVPTPQIGVILPPQDNSIAEREKQEEINRFNQERARIATEAMKQQARILSQNNMMINRMTHQALQPLANFLTIWIIMGILVFIAWVSALVDILKSDFTNSTNKIVWLLVIFFIPLLGSILYFLIGSTQKYGSKSYKDKGQAELTNRLRTRTDKDQDFDIR